MNLRQIAELLNRTKEGVRKGSNRGKTLSKMMLKNYDPRYMAVVIDLHIKRYGIGATRKALGKNGKFYLDTIIKSLS